MCGIAGGIALRRNARPNSDWVKAMSAAMAHRGPDGTGMWTSPSGRAVLAHRRLAVIDLATGAQPMLDETGNVGIVFNGEIYNYRELQESLREEGQSFRTTSDTEVLLQLLMRQGSQSLDRLRGMFAFAVWDDSNNALLIARDRIGKKPLFYCVVDDCLYFASSLAALHTEGIGGGVLDLEALDLFLSLGYIPAPHTIYRDVFKLPAASFATFGGSGLEVRRFWDLADPVQQYSGSYTTALDDLEGRLEQAVALRLRSDVPLGVFLSGGIDSSLVTALAVRKSSQSIQTFCVGFGERDFDESRYAAGVARHLGTNHTTLTAQTCLIDRLPRITRAFGEPYADSSALPLSAITERARPSITVALGGDGGDEGFAGYNWYANAARLDKLASRLPRRVLGIGSRAVNRIPARSRGRHVQQFGRGFTVLALEPAERFAYLRSFVNGPEAELLYDGALLERRRDGLDPARNVLARNYRKAGGSALRRMRYVDMQTYLADDLMPKVDVATMAHSLEARAPLLDQEILAFALSLPDDFLVDARGGKRILRDLLARHVPSSMFERRKQGFSVPLQLWFSGELRNRLENLSESEALADLHAIKPAGIRTLVAEHAAGVRDHSQRLFSLLQLESWLSIQ